MGIPDHLTSLLRNLYAGRKQQLELDMEQQTGSKQEMERVNIDILGISEIKWTGMGNFNSGDHCIYDYGQESLRRNGVALKVNKRVQNAVCVCVC